MQSYSFLLTLAIILLSTRFLGSLSSRVNMPQVVGALMAGVILGPSILGQVDETSFLMNTAEIGVIMLMFLAGLDTDLSELKKNGAASLVIALLGVLLPFGGGFVVYRFFFPANGDPVYLLKCIFMGVILTATSVSITVETLREMGKLEGKVGASIMGAAIIDDILGIILLTLVNSFTDSTVKISAVLIRIALYFIFVGLVGYLMHNIVKQFDVEAESQKRRRIAIYAFAFCLALSYVSEEFFAVADITGAYFAGLFLCNIAGARKYIARKMTVSSYMFFSPVFFASIGIKTDLHQMTSTLFLFSVTLLIVAILTKILGCGLGARLCGCTGLESLNIGVGMVSRGEVALIMAQKGAALGLVSPSIFPAVVLVVIATTLLTPICLSTTIKRL